MYTALKTVWPTGTSPEAAVKRVAAVYLLDNHPQGAYVEAALVASHVKAKLDKRLFLGITKTFEQLLNEDPCFIIDKQSSNTLVALDTAQLLSQASSRRDERQWQQQKQWQQPPQQQQQQQPSVHPQQLVASPPGLASSNSSSTGGQSCLKATPGLLQGLNELWPCTGPAATPEAKVKHNALFQLLKRPQNTMEWFALAFAVNEALGCVDIVQGLGCVLPLDQLLQQEPSIFVFERSARGSPMPAVALDRQGVLNMFVRRHSTGASQHDQLLQPQQPQPQSQPQQQPQPEQQLLGDSLPGVAPDSDVVSAAALLQYVRSRQWHSSDPVLDAVRRALAERMVLQVNTAAAKEGQQPAKSKAKWYNMLGSLAGYTIGQVLEGLGAAAARSPPSLEDCVDQDPYLSIYFAGQVQHIKLDIEQLLQDAAAAAAGMAVAGPQQSQNRQQRPAAAAAADSSNGLRRVVDAAAAAGVGSNQQAAGGPAVHGPSSSTVHAAAPAAAEGRGVQQVSAAALMQHVSFRMWHSSNLQLDLARRTLAEHLVVKANDDVRANRPANSDVEAYNELFSQSGHLINKALRSCYGDSCAPCYKKLADVFTDDPCWQVITPSTPGGQKSVQLNLPLLLQEAAALQDTSAGIGSNDNGSHGFEAQTAADAAVAAARSGSGSASSSSRGGGKPAAVGPLAVAPAAANDSAVVYDALAAAVASSHQAAGWPAVNGTSSSTAHAAARVVQQVSVSALLQHVSSRVWNSSNPQHDAAKWALAQHLVGKGNEGVAAHCPVNANVEAYRDSLAQSGMQICEALKSRFGDSALSFYKKRKKLAEVLTDDPCWQIIPPSTPGGQKSVQLNMLLLLQEASALQDSAACISSNTSHASGVRAAADSAAAAAAAAAGNVAASSGGGGTPAAVRTLAVGPAAADDSAVVVQAAMAAFQAAAMALMPPAVEPSATDDAATAFTPGSAAGAVWRKQQLLRSLHRTVRADV